MPLKYQGTLNIVTENLILKASNDYILNSEQDIVRSPEFKKILANTPISNYKNNLDLLDKLKNFKLIGTGRSGKVYLVEWHKIKKYFNKIDIYTNDNFDKVAFKVLIPMNEIKQRGIWNLPNRTIKNLSKYFHEFKNRNINIYKYLVNNRYFGISDHITTIYACSYYNNNNDNKLTKLVEKNKYKCESLPSMILATEYLGGSNMFNYLKENFQKLANNLTITTISSIIIQGLSIILVLYNNKFYHNDLNLGNLFISETTQSLVLKFPLFNYNLSYNCNNLTIPLLKLIDFDLASLDNPRDEEYKLSGLTKLPIIDIYHFIISFYHQIKKTYRNDLLDKNIDQLFTKLTKNINNVFNLIKDSSLHNISRSCLILNTKIDETTRISYIKDILNSLLDSLNIKIINNK